MIGKIRRLCWEARYLCVSAISQEFVTRAELFLREAEQVYKKGGVSESEALEAKVEITATKRSIERAHLAVAERRQTKATK